MNKKNFKKAGVGLLVSALFVGGAYAWLKNTETATKTNQIKAGSASIKFDNQLNAISLAGNDAIPMTQVYAVENTTIYTFDIVNDGSVALDYNILVKADGYENTFGINAGGESVLKAVLVEVPDGSSTDEIKNLLKAGSKVSVKDGRSYASHSNIAPAETVHYALIVHIDDVATNEQALGKTATFGLEVKATQHVDIAAYYYNASLNALVTGETYSAWDSDYGYVAYDGDVFEYKKDSDPGFSLLATTGDVTWYKVTMSSTQGGSSVDNVIYTKTADEYTVDQEVTKFGPTFYVTGVNADNDLVATQVQ